MSTQVETNLDTATKIMNFTIAQGADFSMDIVYKENGAVIDITGWHAYLEFRSAPGGQLYKRYSDVAPATGITITGAAGMISFACPNTDTVGFNWKECEWDIFVNTGSLIYKLFMGKVTNELRITQV